MIDESKPQIFEKKEAPKPKWESMRVFRVRHGDTIYREQSHDKSLKPKNMDLTEKGKQQILEDAKKIASILNKENDIVCVVASPAERAMNGKQIITDYLEKEGFDIWQDSRADEPQNRVKNLDVINEKGEVVDIQDSEYPEYYFLIKKYFDEETPEDISRMKFVAQHKHENLEKFDSSAERARNQLTKMVRVARNVQPQAEKHIVVVQIEHSETLDDFYTQASKGKYAYNKDTGPNLGEVVQIDIPVDKDNPELTVNFIDRKDNKNKVKYNHIKREFE